MRYVQAIQGLGEHPRAGHRARDLSLLGASGIRIPPGFVILSDALTAVVENNNLTYKISYVLSHITESAHSLVNAYTSVRRILKEAALPDGFETEVRELYSTLDGAQVRLILSLETPEDPESNDGVIQCVSTWEELMVGIREAWSLAYHPSQLRYRRAARIPETDLKVAIIVQAMDEPTRCCHGYSCLPQDREKVYLQTYYGQPDLREKVKKDYFAISRDTLDIVMNEIREQPHLLEIDQKGELVLAPLEKTRDDRMIDREVQELARLTKKAERTLGTPVKAFFSCKDEIHRLLWVNRLGFDVIIDDADAPVDAPSRTPKTEIAAGEYIEIPVPSATEAVPERPTEPPVPPSHGDSHSTPPAAAPSKGLLHAAFRIASKSILDKYHAVYGNDAPSVRDAVAHLNETNALGRRIDPELMEKLEHDLTLSAHERERAEEELSYLLH